MMKKLLFIMLFPALLFAQPIQQNYPDVTVYTQGKNVVYAWVGTQDYVKFASVKPGLCWSENAREYWETVFRVLATTNCHWEVYEDDFLLYEAYTRETLTDHSVCDYLLERLAEYPYDTAIKVNGKYLYRIGDDNKKQQWCPVGQMISAQAKVAKRFPSAKGIMGGNNKIETIEPESKELSK